MSSTEHLSEQQAARLEALLAAREVSRTTTGALGGSRPPDVPDLVDLAEYIIHGLHPHDRYSDQEMKPDVQDA